MNPKHSLLKLLRDSAPGGIHWALRGGEVGLAAWLESASVKDVDLWVHSEEIKAFARALSPRAVSIISLESDPRWLRHVVLVMTAQFGGQLVDITFGDLKVGGALTCRESLITTRQGPDGPVLAGVAAVSDLLLRKLLRGKAPDRARIAEARAHWLAAPGETREAWLSDLELTFGKRLTQDVRAILNGRVITRQCRLAFVLAAARASLRHSGLPLMVRRRRRMVMGRRRRILLKRPVAPVLFQVSGVQGDQVTSLLEEVLQGLGVATQHLAGRPDANRLDSLRSVGRCIKAGLYGHALIVTGDGTGIAAARAPFTILTWPFGRVIRILTPGPATAATPRPPGTIRPADHHADTLGWPMTRADITENYYLAAHRWYIDDMAAARQLTAADSTVVDPATSEALNPEV
ncbi:hypothetical protein [Halomonas heilongjiangensis]|uniref:Uncharacterized protein n=1 Tax=Halomonas heilongjiangensis TaxID=1387883 RepID=A0A2N7TUK7_9GAMM|nr:hypothetical protein [Halomonas heilongjiangensis]PMR71861.1 hypothetical protein C1H66_01060 [Halomonas heilongjiangensis]PXX87676.1 hypothetical protein CR158_17895 [Halomonas heilongjiangensis]